MAGLFGLEVYECEDLPETFYRVTYPGSLPRDEDTGDYASDSDLEITDEANLKELAEDHFCWRRISSPFISVFSNERHARNWAYKRVDKLGCGLDEVYISKIRTAQLPAGTLVFEATFLADVLEIYHPYAEDEYLILYRISHEAITSTRSLEEIQAADLADMFGSLQVDEPLKILIDEE